MNGIKNGRRVSRGSSDKTETMDVSSWSRQGQQVDDEKNAVSQGGKLLTSAPRRKSRNDDDDDDVVLLRFTHLRVSGRRAGMDKGRRKKRGRRRHGAC